MIHGLRGSGLERITDPRVVRPEVDRLGPVLAQPRVIDRADDARRVGGPAIDHGRILDFNDAAEHGYHGRLGLQVGALGVPLAGRLEGEYHTFGQVEGLPKVNVLNAALSAVLSLDGVGLTPYFLAGVRISATRWRIPPDSAWGEGSGEAPRA